MEKHRLIHTQKNKKKTYPQTNANHITVSKQGDKFIYWLGEGKKKTVILLFHSLTTTTI
ncbi:MAG: hypothetical protein HN726_00700 [Candidatus Magasanikbacteria bacterium]|nr:hypothetical protein [Candidatus Magasanikbacteria bacterium]